MFSIKTLTAYTNLVHIAASSTLIGNIAYYFTNRIFIIAHSHGSARVL